MPETPLSLEYQCPVCGEKAVAGNHFCGKTVPQKVRLKPAKVTRIPRTVWTLVVPVTAAVLWWPVIGPWSLLFLLLITGILLLWGKRSP